jgi:hypothetical protein
MPDDGQPPSGGAGAGGVDAVETPGQSRDAPRGNAGAAVLHGETVILASRADILAPRKSILASRADILAPGKNILASGKAFLPPGRNDASLRENRRTQRKTRASPGENVSCPEKAFTLRSGNALGQQGEGRPRASIAEIPG